jgi:hypothetical protein
MAHENDENEGRHEIKKLPKVCTRFTAWRAKRGKEVNGMGGLEACVPKCILYILLPQKRVT